jgi:uncharacterized protein (TIGR00369 family)
VTVEAGRVVDQMVVPPTLLDQHGALAPGALAILADSALGWAVMSTMPAEAGMATSHLHLELLRPINPGTTRLTCTAEQRGIEGRFGIGEGDITTADGTSIARATIGAVILTRRSGGSGPQVVKADAVDTAEPRPHQLIAGSPVHQLLGMRVLSAGPTGVHVTVRADPSLANFSGGVHGGVGVLIGERTLDLALRAAIVDERQLRPVELRAAFLRPIAADGQEVEAVATVMHLGRRLAAARGEVRDQEGRAAVLVDATYVGP